MALYVAGESYGGVYAPMLADAALAAGIAVHTPPWCVGAGIAVAGVAARSEPRCAPSCVDGSQGAAAAGVLVGNGITDDRYDMDWCAAQLPYFRGHGGHLR
eukprot:gene12203-55709_t